MGKMLASLMGLQAVERKAAVVRRRLKSRQNAVALQQRRIAQLRADWDALHSRAMDCRKEADSLAVDLKEKEDLVARRRGSLNTAKTNKEYAAILTEINTVKADNARIEESALKAMQEVDATNAEADELQTKIDAEDARLAQVSKSSQEEITRLEAMLASLEKDRDQAAAAVPPQALKTFNRIVATYDGEAMAVIEVHGRKPPYSYVCGGCFMSLTPEHANALRVRDEVRTCDNCGRILCMAPETEQSAAT